MKTTLWLTALAILFLVVFSQCRKDKKGEYAIQGKVTNARTGAALSGASVVMQKQTVSGGTYSSAYSNAASTTSDAAGNYHLTWERENFAGLKLLTSYPQFITKEITLQVSSFSVGNTPTQNVQLYPEAYISVSLKNILHPAMSDVVNFTFVNAHFDCFCCSNGYRTFSGVTDTTFQCKLYGDQWLKYQSIFNLGGSDSLVMDSVWCPSFETTQLQIVY